MRVACGGEGAEVKLNWKLLVVPLVPTVSILHTQWLCLLLGREWGTFESSTAAVMVAIPLTLLAAFWAAGFKL